MKVGDGFIGNMNMSFESIISHCWE